jgi:hypothetical protein
MQWIVPLLVILLYVQLFNVISPLSFESDRTLTLTDLWTLIKRNLGLSAW